MKDELEDFINSCEDLINDRIDIISEQISKNTSYKKKYYQYSKIYDELLKKNSLQDIEVLTNSIFEISDIENKYIYLKGFIDGILLREQFGKNKKVQN